MRQLKISQNITARESISLEKYFHDVNRIKMINIDDEAVLSKLIKEGDSVALDKLIRGNLRFVVSVAKQYQNRNLTLNDLINEGNIGLIKAAKKFDHTRGFKFISYAVWWVRQSIMQALAENSRMVRMPLNRVGTLNRIKRTSATLQQEFEREPTSEELARVLQMSETEVDKTLEGNMQQLSIDAPFSNDDDNSLLDTLINKSVDDTDKNMVYKNSLSVEAERSLLSLKPKNRKIIKMFFGIGEKSELSLDEISKKLGLTRERVRQLKEKALKKLRQSSQSSNLIQYLGK